ncbi:Epoxide hydrolase N terminus [Acrodontium crateriforme]|uniref:Epoxide hydrolase N terminus n=1 Tax=Acrodontium crateriforme TaxID=150365 RepID=A0AAQ3M276_9PEZI|nr:Epoxide hydrolase N terminus [Acrodontium crateriforme]
MASEQKENQPEAVRLCRFMDSSTAVDLIQATATYAKDPTAYLKSTLGEEEYTRKKDQLCLADKIDLDMYGKGEHKQHFERHMANVVGKEHGLFFLTGVQAQLAALKIYCERAGTGRVAWHVSSHLEEAEERAFEKLYGLERTLLGSSPDELPTVEEILDVIQAPAKERPAVILIEIPNRTLGCATYTFAQLERISSACQTAGVALHCDGARLWEIEPWYQETAGKSFADLGRLFTSIYLSFYKGLRGAAGAILAHNDATFISEAKVWQRRAGGNAFTLLHNLVDCERGYNLNIGTFARKREKMINIAQAINEATAEFVAADGKPIVGWMLGTPFCCQTRTFFHGYTAEQLTAARDRVQQKTTIRVFERIWPKESLDQKLKLQRAAESRTEIVSVGKEGLANTDERSHLIEWMIGNVTERLSTSNDRYLIVVLPNINQTPSQSNNNHNDNLPNLRTRGETRPPQKKTRYCHFPRRGKSNTITVKLTVRSNVSKLDGAAWDYGAPLSEIKRLAKYWTETYDWRSQEKKLNALPNFHTGVHVTGFGELDIHFLHQRSDSANAIPLLFCHGWPGSYLEATKIMDLLKESKNGVSFHVVVPSLPNFGWSQGVKKTGFGLKQYAETNHRLMQSLGYERYVTHGGDWGFYITRTMGLLYPDSVLASHLTLIRGKKPTWSSHPLLALQHAITPYSAAEHAGLARTNWFTSKGSGYRTIQSTKPQTVGYALTDSPIGLLAWIYEKLHDWTDEYPWTDDEILTWVSLYYFSTAGPAASLRIYYEAIYPPPGGFSRDRTQEYIPKVKIGYTLTPKELALLPLTWCRTLGPVVQERRKMRGGHFLAHELPDETVKDLRDMFGKGGPCYGIVGNKAKL